MCRITLSRYDDSNDQRVVVGYDHALQTFFWQDFHPEMGPADGEGDWNGDPMISYGGYMPREYETIEAFQNRIPECVVDLMTEQLMKVLDNARHMPSNWKVDLSGEYAWKPYVIADDSGSWARNAQVFATFDEAMSSAAAMERRWILVRERCAMPTNDPVNYKFDNNKEVAI